MPDISYFDAWRMWADGRSTLGNDLLGMPMIWWGRIGKIAAFFAGTTIVLDILGPDRLQAASAWTERATDSTLVLLGFGVAFALPAVGAIYWVMQHYPVWDEGYAPALELIANVFSVLGIGLAGGVVGMMLLTFLLTGIFRLFASGVGHPRAVPLRVAAAALFLVGFHFDLLAS